ncbi:acetylglutamate kinase [Halobacteriales archaeon QH_10_67_22]|jgi:isopentenyl phosphate kinase|nr:MAG: acetylglutamate kinase [Halobacteriales archaeon QH_10_67_22]
MTTVLKLGGSVITDKSAPETVDADALAAAATAVTAGATDPAGELVVVHGGGSFGHHHAAEHGVSATEGTDDAATVREIHDAMGRLNAAVLDALGERGVPALPVRPLSAAARDEDSTLTLATTAVERQLGEGFCPVLHGDVVVHEGAGATILSGDEIVAALARSLSVDRVGLCSTVPGVLDADGDVVERVERFADVAEAVGASDATDVTGGMAGKVRTLLDLPVPASVFGSAALRGFLDGDRPGTLVAGPNVEE